MIEATFRNVYLCAKNERHSQLFFGDFVKMLQTCKDVTLNTLRMLDHDHQW